MYKKIIVAIILINISPLFVYSMIDTNNTRGFYFDTSLYGRYEPGDGGNWSFTDFRLDNGHWANGGWFLSFFYRKPIREVDLEIVDLDSENGKSWFNNTKLEFGLSNALGIEGDTLEAYIEVVPVDFFSIKARIGGVLYSTWLNGLGFYTFESASADYNHSVFADTSAEEKIGYFVEVSPTFKLDIYRFSLIATLNVMYQDMFVDGFYYDRFTYFVRKNQSISLVLDSYLMFNISPVNVGVNYTLAYVGDYNDIGHRIGMSASFVHAFSQILSLYIDLNIGQYFEYSYLTRDAYVEIALGIQLKIF